MTTSLKRHLQRRTSVLAPLMVSALAALLLSAPAQALDKTESRQAEQRFQDERAVCNSGRSNQDRSTCLYEAQSAYAEARKGLLGDGEAAAPANLNQRCQALAGDERQDCMARMSGRGTTSGSVEAGGIYRELKTYSTAPAVTAPAVSPTMPPVMPAVMPPAAAASSVAADPAPK